MALKGSGMIVIDNEEHPLDADHLARIGFEHKPKLGWTGPAYGRFSGCCP